MLRASAARSVLAGDRGVCGIGLLGFRDCGLGSIKFIGSGSWGFGFRRGSGFVGFRIFGLGF